MEQREVYGKYQLLTKIATGGMAEVWLARSSSIGGFEKLLAIKRMHSRLSTNQGFISLFIEEAKLSVALNHPNIVQVFDFGRVDDDYFIAMEFVEGVDLAHLGTRARNKGVPLPVEATALMVRELFQGLAFAHGRRDRQGRSVGIIHRDVSPHNVLVSFDGLVKISDFGIAKAAEELKRQGAGEVVGKLAYMSPEQARGQTLTPATDVWAAGVILWELLANTRLFAKETDQDTMKAVAELVVPPPSSYNAATPPALDQLVLKVLERDLARRPESAREVAEELTDILRTNFPRMSEYRLAEIVAGSFDGELPNLIPADSSGLSQRPDPHNFGIEHTLSSGTKTSHEIAQEAVIEATAVSRPAGRQGSIPPLAMTISSARTISSAGLLLDAQGRSPQVAPSIDHSGAPTVSLPDDASTPPTDVAQAVASLREQFRTNPSLWILFDIGEIYEHSGLEERALGAYHLAAAKFAQRGWLVQAAAIACRILALDGNRPEVVDAIRALPGFQGLPDDHLLIDIVSRERALALPEFEELLGPSPAHAVEIISPVPIFSSLDREQFARLVQALRVRMVPPGEVITKEGDPGDAFFWIGRGRVLVSATNFAGKRVYLTSLADGDCFGEHAFFTQGRTRTATVEAIEDVVLLEIGRESLQQVIQEFPAVRESLREFYKDRVAEMLLARSSMFGQLTVRDRRALAQRFGFVTHAAGDLVLKEGDQSDAFYAIKSGRVEVFAGEPPRRLAILDPGEVFGEIAALKGTPRVASVRALEDCELLKLEAADLKRFLAANPEIRGRIETQMEERSASAARTTAALDPTDQPVPVDGAGAGGT